MAQSNPFPPDNADPAFGEVPPVQGYSTPPPSSDGFEPTSGYESNESTPDVAKQQAVEVAGSAADAGKHVAGVAQDQAQQVAGEVKSQAKDLLHQTRGELTDQAATQQKRVASGLRALGDELGSMAHGSDNQGVASDLVRQAAERTGSIASWLDDREPGHVLDEVTRFARRRPGAFLAIAAGAGLLAGRLGRGLMADASDDSGASGQRASHTQAPTEQQFNQYSSDATGGYAAPTPESPTSSASPIGDPAYTPQHEAQPQYTQPQYTEPTTQFRAPTEDYRP